MRYTDKDGNVFSSPPKYEDEALATLSYNWYMNGQSTRNRGKLDPSWNEYPHPTANILHGALGISTEAAEILDAVKKSIFYGKPFDLVNLQEEIGDCFWYLAILAKEAGMSFEDIMAQNIAKLKVRYPGKFTEYHALNRNLEAERDVLDATDGLLDG